MYRNQSKEKLKKLFRDKKEKKKINKGKLKVIENCDGFLEIEKCKNIKKINVDLEFDIKKKCKCKNKR